MCDEPPDITDAVRRFSNTSYRSVVEYECIQGTWFSPGVFTLWGTCGDGGVWLYLPYTTCTRKLYLLLFIYLLALIMCIYS